MTTEIVCPFCHFSKKIPEKMIPVRAKWAICPRCNQKFEIPLLDKETRPFDEKESSNRGQYEAGQEFEEEPIRDSAP